MDTRIVGDFTLLELAATGGFSEVWRAEHRPSGAAAALKLLRAGHASLSRNELASVARLEHPHIVPVWDAGVEGDRTWLASPWMDGGTVRKQPPRDYQELSALVEALLSALAHAHAHSILHRDVKPSNVLLDTLTGQWRLTDFGIAVSMLGRDQAPAGTLRYAAPEVLVPNSVLRPWTDLYALAATIWHLTTGQPPFTGTPAEVREGHLREAPGPFQPLYPVPEGFDDWLYVLLRKKPEARAVFAADAHAAFRALGGAAPVPVPDIELDDGAETLWLDDGDDEVAAPSTLPLGGLQPMPPAPPEDEPRWHRDPRSPNPWRGIGMPRYPRLQGPLIQPVWDLLLEVRATARAQVRTLHDPDLRAAVQLDLGVRATESGQALLMYVTDGQPLPEAIRTHVGLSGERARDLRAIRQWDGSSSDEAASTLDGLDDPRVLAGFLGRVARRRALLLLLPGTDADRIALARAIAPLEAPVLCIGGTGELIALPEWTEAQQREVLRHVSPALDLDAAIAMGFEATWRSLRTREQALLAAWS